MLTWVPTAHSELLQTFALLDPCIGGTCVVSRICAVSVIVDIALFLSSEALLYHRATASKYKSLIFRYAFQSLTSNSHSEISKLALIIRQLYPCENFDAVALRKLWIALQSPNNSLLYQVNSGH